MRYNPLLLEPCCKKREGLMAVLKKTRNTAREHMHYKKGKMMSQHVKRTACSLTPVPFRAWRPMLVLVLAALLTALIAACGKASGASATPTGSLTLAPRLQA